MFLNKVNYKNKYENKVVWITGASSGIGEQLVYKLNAVGAKLIISSRNDDKLNIIVRNCSNGFNVKIIPVDLSESKSLREKCTEAMEAFGHIDYLFNVAGVGHRDFALSTGLEIDRKIMQINYFGTIELSKFVLAEMIKQGKGQIIVTSSLSGKYGVPMLSAYSASKHALHGFFDSIRGELKNKNVKITIVIPGFVNTDINHNALKGDGTQYGRNLKVQENGYPADKCAEKILKAVAKEKEEVFIGGNERISLLINRFFPRTHSKIIRNHPVKKLRKLKNIFMFNKKEV